MRRISLPSPSMAVALLALAVALGGTSYAAIVITGKNVRNGSLSGADVRNGSLRSADVRDRSLRSRDFRAGQLPVSRGYALRGGLEFKRSTSLSRALPPGKYLVTASAGAYNTSQGAEIDNARCVLRASDGSLNGGGGELGFSGRLGPLGLGTVFVQDSLSITQPVTVSFTCDSTYDGAPPVAFGRLKLNIVAVDTLDAVEVPSRK
jgi:hypothetical protein